MRKLKHWEVLHHTICNGAGIQIQAWFLNIVVVQSLSHVWLFATPWTAACQVSLLFTIPQSSLKLMSVESEIPSNHLILLSSTPSPALSLSQHLGLLSCTLYQAYYRLVPTAGISVMRLSKISKQSCKICYHILQIWNLSLSKRGWHNWSNLAHTHARKVRLFVVGHAGLSGKESASAGDAGSSPWVGKFPWQRKCNLLQYSCLGNPMDRGAWQAAVRGAAKSRTGLRDWTELNWICWNNSNETVKIRIPKICSFESRQNRFSSII